MLIFSQIDSKKLKYSVLRIPGPESAPMFIEDGWAQIIPIRIIKGTPSISGCNLVVEERIRMAGSVRISPALDVLLIFVTGRDGPQVVEASDVIAFRTILT